MPGSLRPALPAPLSVRVSPTLPGGVVRTIAAAVIAPLLFIVMAAGAQAQQDGAAAGRPGAVEEGALPVEAQRWLPELEAHRAASCPQLPLGWLVAQVQVQSSWEPRAYSSAGGAGLLQVMPQTWTRATGGPGWAVDAGPAPDHPVWDPSEHLAGVLPWMCDNLERVSAHLARTGKPAPPLDALTVCHVAGCSRVTGSASGVPEPREAGCGRSCSAAVRDHIDAVNALAAAYLLPAPVAEPSSAAAAQPWRGEDTGCTVPDPTGTGGCVTPATAWLLDQVATAFPGASASCWDAHAWNPRSDHPAGRACDYSFGRPGTFPGEADAAAGWQMAQWLQDNADALDVAYLIWQGRIWWPAGQDERWRTYTGGGVYDPTDATGGHFDHIHISLQRERDVPRTGEGDLGRDHEDDAPSRPGHDDPDGPAPD
jgi:hypothetical protein